MLVPLLEMDFEQYADFAYELALDPKKSGYPAYFDGIKTKKDFIRRSKKAFERPNEEILLYQLDGRTEGWLHYGYWAEDRYIFLCTCAIRRNTADALTELQEYLSVRCPGWELAMGFSTENEEAVDWLVGAGFSKLQDADHYTLFFDQYSPVPEDPGTERITEENFDKFQRIHRTIEAEMYWNCQRVREHFARWDLFVAEEDGVGGEIMALDEGNGLYEIFALACEDGQVHINLCRRLLTAVLNEGKRKNERCLIFFIEPDSQENQILLPFGFHFVDRYTAYHKFI